MVDIQLNTNSNSSFFFPRTGDVAQLVEGLPGMHEDSIPSPAAQVGMDMPVIPAPEKRRQEDQKYKLTLGYTVSSRPAWFQSLHETLSLKNKIKKKIPRTLLVQEK